MKNRSLEREASLAIDIIYNLQSEIDTLEQELDNKISIIEDLEYKIDELKEKIIELENE